MGSEISNWNVPKRLSVNGEKSATIQLFVVWNCQGLPEAAG